MIDKDWDLYGSDIEEFSYLEVSESIANSMIEDKYEYSHHYSHCNVYAFAYGGQLFLVISFCAVQNIYGKRCCQSRHCLQPNRSMK